MDSKKTDEIVNVLIYMGSYKSKLPIRDILIRGFQSGALLGISTVLAYTVAIQSSMYFLGALAFPVGFAIIILIGYELVTSNFAIVPMSVMDGQSTLKDLLHSWVWAFTGNLIGSIFFGMLFFVYITQLGRNYDHDIIDKIIHVAQDKTLAYKSLGSIGLVIVFTKAFLCNWMVTMGGVMGTVSTSTIGRIVALWLPIFLFFALGLEHSVVNMFVIPTAILLKAEITISDWWLWNQIPATLGNIVGGVLMTAIPLYLTFKKKAHH
ncbi:MAG: formate/nitrite transporter family protein [Crocinitomicaceae bacterium]|nr:formate/nitrite transporter family protein [Crocinitomicaceae bacterium]